MEFEHVLFAFALTLFAGLSTGIGSSLAFFAKKTNTKLLSISLGFSAGVMIYVSFAELFSQARETLIEELGEKTGNLYTVIAFFLGMLLIALIDKLIPSFENPHEMRRIEEIEELTELEKANEADLIKQKKLMKMGIVSALAIAIHNFPEGLATFSAALKDPTLGVSIAVAIAIHNIPEGIAVSIPLYYATGKKLKSFILSFLSGLAEPIGAIIGYFLLMPFLNDTVFGFLFSFVAGIMVFISLDELLPSAEKYGEHHLSIYGLIAGMAIMAISLLLFI
ncbi:MAG: zinc transporter ZupT [Bacteroidales bacterium]|nr:zinc transporter ZupT [Bacteroidales bacterium]MBN2756209.1 zinc transporter ZupT [Bacteroidales bacterium]